MNALFSTHAEYDSAKSFEISALLTLIYLIFFTLVLRSNGLATLRAFTFVLLVGMILTPVLFVFGGIDLTFLPYPTQPMLGLAVALSLLGYGCIETFYIRRSKTGFLKATWLLFIFFSIASMIGDLYRYTMKNTLTVLQMILDHDSLLRERHLVNLIRPSIWIVIGLLCLRKIAIVGRYNQLRSDTIKL